MMILLVIVLWLSCGVVGYGLIRGYWIGEFPNLREGREDAKLIPAGIILFATVLGFLIKAKGVRGFLKHGFKI